MNPEYNQTLSELPVEKAIFNLRRHPIGIIAVYVVSSILLIALAVVAFGLVPKYMNSGSSSDVIGIASVSYFIFMIFVVGFVYISHIVYWDNTWTLSDESLTQVARTSLFDKQSSHLSLGNLQDVTASKEGILQHLFNYGSLRVETAGERSKFVFQFCPNPDTYADYILEARERFEQGNRIVNDGLQSPVQPRAQAEPSELPVYPLPPQPPVASA